ncbi:hypothetical protein [Motilimonas sp. KMU-193]|uniref:hypothetical protein n=1 Tax=Motilimonas sp. KMU-193 TaxID=3388668 RepID=UPI00396B33D4
MVLQWVLLIVLGGFFGMIGFILGTKLIIKKQWLIYVISLYAYSFVSILFVNLRIPLADSWLYFIEIPAPNWAILAAIAGKTAPLGALISFRK